ncbi:TPA: hypothetical protein N0F65_010371 [Lagenidium giganteum]|uniref:Beta-adaptin appendage C-terminal subdomain domain-containing protein n=1 Tax=Lagenidium giganteum TaxID=4803 RepID=A0AAV2YHN2_9STRA|nr:TPA: hypothetical protein N0F65_010371 [Lagenidium giganteum]
MLANFRHAFRGGIVEITREEYERGKQSVLKKIRRRVLILGILLGLLGLASIALGVVAYAYFPNFVQFKRKTWTVALRNIYFIHGGTTLLFSVDGFYVDSKWRKMREDGNRLIMHVRLFSVLGVAAWITALWVGVAMINSFGLLEVQDVAQSSPNLIYLASLVMASIHLLVAPWLLRTIHRKGSQADEFFGAEFLAEVKRSRQRGDDVDCDRDNDSEEDCMAAVRPDLDAPATHGPGRRGSKSQPSPQLRGSPTRIRTVFFNADGSSSYVPTITSPVAAGAPMAAAAMGETSPRSRRRASGSFTTARGRDTARMNHASATAAVDPPTRPQPMNLNAVIAETVLSASQASNVDQLPFAAPVFMMDRVEHLAPPAFWSLWREAETAGSFSCTFINHPTKKAVEAHLQSYGFHLIETQLRDNVLQVYFYAYQFGTDLYFLCEFVFIYSRRFFQATFKCKERDVASDFVTRFNLQDLLQVAPDDQSASQ